MGQPNCLNQILLLIFLPSIPQKFILNVISPKHTNPHSFIDYDTKIQLFLFHYSEALTYFFIIRLISFINSQFKLHSKISKQLISNQRHSLLQILLTYLSFNQSFSLKFLQCQIIQISTLLDLYRYLLIEKLLMSLNYP